MKGEGEGTRRGGKLKEKRGLDCPQKRYPHRNSLQPVFSPTVFSSKLFRSENPREALNLNSEAVLSRHH